MRAAITECSPLANAALTEVTGEQPDFDETDVAELGQEVIRLKSKASQGHVPQTCP